jgi:hypothetical protein
MDEPTQSTSQQSQTPSGVSTTLIDTLSKVIQRLPAGQPYYLFVIGVGILVVILVLGVYSIAPDIPMPMYVALGVIGILALATLVVGVIGLVVQARLLKTTSKPQQRSSSDAPSVDKSLAEQPPVSKRKRPGVDLTGVNNSMSEFDKLRGWLDKLLDNEFRDMIRALLTSTEQTRLSAPVTTIDRGAFLGAMQVLGRLNEVEHYLREKYPDRFSR